jgi:hypothetical protein
MRSQYHTDFVAWADETAKLLRQPRFEAIDLDALVEEVEGLAKRDRKAMRSQLQRLLIHLLTWQYLPNDLEQTRSSWGATINHARNELADDMQDSPSLRCYPAEVLDRVYQRARREAWDQTQLDLLTFPEQCPWSIENILGDGWCPQTADWGESRFWGWPGSCSFPFFASPPRPHRRGERPFAPPRPHGHPLACGAHLVAGSLMETGETRHENCIALGAGAVS